MAWLSFCAGSVGCGKSTLVRWKTRRARRRVIVDKSRDWELHAGFPAARNLKELSRHIARNWGRGFAIAYTPPRGEGPERLNDVADLVMRYQSKYAHGETLHLIVDEMGMVYSNTDMQRRICPAFEELITECRHYHVEVWGATQTPATVATYFRNLCDDKFFFRMNDASARQVVLGSVGREWAATLNALSPGEFIANEAGRVSLGRLHKSQLRETRFNR